MLAPERKRYLLHIAAQCVRDGRIEDGISAYQSLLALDDSLSDAWYNLGYLHRCARHFDAAIEAYRKALAVGIDHPEEVRLNIAVILSEHLNRPEAAADELTRALKENAEFIPAWLNLGNLHEDLGEPQSARSAYENALKVAPGNGRALGRIATIDVFQGKANESVRRLRGALAANDFVPEDVAEIYYALGHSLDALGEFDEAFTAFAAANRASLESSPPGSRYDPKAQERLVDDLIRTFSEPAEGVASPDSKAPIFICGMFRSGSTLAEQVLASHSRVTAGGEFEFVPALVAQQLQPYPQSIASPAPGRLAELRETYLRDLNAIHPEYDIITDKRPDNFLHIGLIKSLFPAARIVHTTRHPADNILSIYFGNFDRGINYGNDLSDIMHWYEQYKKLMAHWQKLYRGDIHDFDYDAVVADPAPEIRDLLEFCQLEWEDACRERTSANRAIRTLSAWQVRQPLHGRSSGRWKHYEAYLQEISSALQSV